MVSLASFRYPAQTETRKGIIHYVNGYGDYALRYAFMGQQFAKAGYDFVTLDPKGFGHSEGTRGYIESVDRICEDQMKFNTLIEEKFDGKGVPKLQLGYSMGGLVSLRLSAQNPKYFSGNGLITPYLGFKDKKIDELANSGFLKTLDRFVPWLRVPIPEEARKKSNVNKFLQTINNDPLIENRKICVHTMVMNQTALKQFSSEAEKIETPFIMILGGKDTVVDNKAAKDFFNLTSSKITDKDIVVYDDGDHFMALDNDYSSMLIKDLIAWYNTHI
ncbi:hypothetical protein FGO68_gene7195 [Halteria grandinella]|uniref:Serine aminopeptidase S33 domain-containing protein n=1 Tax=Halteria grandinella TaxID=5974 RepID=A0A8J8T203_HALGN|nr:hypothetical protein FGO68_gene7195 [Halteria grandinella]